MVDSNGLAQPKNPTITVVSLGPGFLSLFVGVASLGPGLPLTGGLALGPYPSRGLRDVASRGGRETDM